MIFESSLAKWNLNIYNLESDESL
jgi:hypothetical protein